MPPCHLFTFSDRQKAESADSYTLLSDGRHYRLRAGLAHLPVASSVRMADLSYRLAAFEEPDGLHIDAAFPRPAGRTGRAVL